MVVLISAAVVAGAVATAFASDVRVVLGRKGSGVRGVLSRGIFRSAAASRKSDSCAASDIATRAAVVTLSKVSQAQHPTHEHGHLRRPINKHDSVPVHKGDIQPAHGRTRRAGLPNRRGEAHAAFAEVEVSAHFGDGQRGDVAPATGVELARGAP